MSKHIHLSLVELGGEPPTEFQIFPAGEARTKRGTFAFDEVAAESVMNAATEHGADFSIDINHQSLNPNPANPLEAAKAAGFFRVELRDGALWAVNVRWTEVAAAAIRAREFRFISPAVGIDPESGRLTHLINIALTNVPAMNGLEPLMAASITGTSPEKAEKPMKTILAALSLSETATEADALAKVAKVVDFQRAVFAMVGAENQSDAIACVKAQTIKCKKFESLSDQLSKLDSEKRSALIEAAVEDLRLPPAERDEMVEFGEKYGTDALKFSLSKLKKDVDSEEDLKADGAGAGSSSVGRVRLTAEETAVFAKFGVTSEDFNKLAPEMREAGIL